MKLFPNLVFVLVCFYQISSFALFTKKDNNPSEVASFCSYYDNLSDDELVLQNMKKYKEQGGHTVYQYPNSTESISYKDLVKNRYEGLDFRLDVASSDFRKKLSLWTAHLSLKAQERFHGAFDLDLDEEVNNNLKACLQKNISEDVAIMYRLISSPKFKTNKDLSYEEIIGRNFISSISLAAVIEMRKNIEKSYRSDRKTLLSERAVLKAQSIGLYGSLSSSNNNKDKLSAIDSQLNLLDTIYLNTKAIYDRSYYQLAKQAPLLFRFENDAEILNWIHQDLVPSEFYYLLMDSVDEKLWKTMRNRVALAEGPEALADIFYEPLLEDKLNSILRNMNTNPRIRNAAKTSAEQYVNSLNHHMNSICEEESTHKLHYNKQLVESLFEQNLRHYGHKRFTVKDQAGYCQLLREDPPLKKTSLNSYEKLGFSSFVTGMSVHFLTGRLKWANSLFALGTGAFIYNGREEGKVNELLLSSTYTMVPNGFSSAGEYHKLLNRRGEIITASAFDILGSGAAVVGLQFLDSMLIRSMMKNYNVKDYEFGSILKFVKPITRGKVTQGLFRQGEMDTWMGWLSRTQAGEWGKHTRLGEWLRKIAHKLGGDSKISEEMARKRYLALAKEKAELLESMTTKYERVRSLKISREWLGGLSLNFDLSGYLKFRQKSRHLDLVVNALKKNSHLKEGGIEKFEKLKKVLLSQKKTSQILQESIDSAFNAKLLLPKLDEIDSLISKKDFIKLKYLKGETPRPPKRLNSIATIYDGSLYIKTKIMKDGKMVEFKKSFAIYMKFSNYKRYIGNSASRGVSNSVMHESLAWSSWSELMQALYTSSLDYRLFEVAFKQLKNTRLNYKLSAEQEEIYKLLKEVMAKMPRVDTTFRVLVLENAWEAVRAMKRLILRVNSGASELTDGYEQFKKTNGWLKHLRTIFYGSLVTGAGTFLANMYDEGSYPHQLKELYLQKIREVERVFSIHRATTEERICAKAVRPLEFLICFHRLAFSEVGFEWSVLIGSEEGILTNSNLKRRIRSYTDRLLRLRRKFRVAEVFALNQSTYEKKIKESSIEILTEKILERLPGNEQVSREILGQLIFDLFQEKDDAEFFKTLEEIKIYYPGGMAKLLQQAWQKKADLFKDINEKGTLGYELEELISVLKTKSKQSESYGFLDLFENNLIMASEHASFSESLDKSVHNILSSHIGREGEAKDRNGGIQAILDQMEREELEEKNRREKDKAERKKLEDELLNN